MTLKPQVQGSKRDSMVTLFDIPGCANDIGTGRCDECIRRLERARMRQRRRIRRRARRAKRFPGGS
jgi:hypothetical protein